MLLVQKTNKKCTLVKLTQEEKQKTKYGRKNKQHTSIHAMPPYYSVKDECDLQKWILSSP